MLCSGMVLELEQLLKHNNLKTWSWVSEPNQALNPWLEAVEMKLKLKGTKVLFLVTYEGVVKKNWPILQELQMCKNNQIPIHVVIAEGNSRDDISKGLDKSSWGLQTLLTGLEMDTAEETMKKIKMV